MKTHIPLETSLCCVQLPAIQHANLRQTQCCQWVRSLTPTSVQHPKLRGAMALAQWPWKAGEFPMFSLPGTNDEEAMSPLGQYLFSSPVKPLWQFGLGDEGFSRLSW